MQCFRSKHNRVQLETANYYYFKQFLNGFYLYLPAPPAFVSKANPLTGIDFLGMVPNC